MSAQSNSSSSSSTYAEAKKVLNASAPERVVCRAREGEELKNYLTACFSNKRAMSIYVNGHPGTGKTLLVTTILDELKVEITF